jgi:hypothetical protein
MYENIIVIPYRNRESQLNFFIKNIVPLIQEHLPKSKILVIEQNEGKLFNRGALLNVAFKEYKIKPIFFYIRCRYNSNTRNYKINLYKKNNRYVSHQIST